MAQWQLEHSNALYYVDSIKSVPTLMEKYDKKIFFVLTDLGMLQRPYSFLFSFAFLCQQQQMQKKKNTSVLKNT